MGILGTCSSLNMGGPGSKLVNIFYQDFILIYLVILVGSLKLLHQTLNSSFINLPLSHDVSRFCDLTRTGI